VEWSEELKIVMEWRGNLKLEEKKNSDKNVTAMS
jgi:hypothetical protein